MPSPESFPDSEQDQNKGEQSGETSRSTFKRRGETTLEAKALAEEKAKNERIAELYAELQAEEEKLASIKARRAELERTSNPEPTLSPNPEAETTPTSPASESETPPENTPETSDSPETPPTPEAVHDTAEKAKKSSGFKKLVKSAAIIALAGLALGTGILIGSSNRKNSPNSDVSTPTYTEALPSAEENEVIGIYDGYGEKGMWLSENKKGPYNFANAAEVAEVCDNDEVEMIKYTARNQVESYADYLANLPESLQPEGFKGLSILETEQRLESLSDEEYELIQKQFEETMDNAFTRRVVLNGKYDNAYMSLKDPDGPVDHDNMQLVRCTTNENNLEVTEFYWVDENGDEIGSMTSKITPIYDEKGNIIGFKGCEQITSKDGDKPDIYVNIPEIPTPNPEPEPTPTPTPTPEQPAPKDEDNLIRIDENINKDIAEDIHTEEVVVTPTPSEEVTSEDITSRPTGNAYEGTQPDIIQNEVSEGAEEITTSSTESGSSGEVNTISPENNYGENLGGANSNNAAENPVEENPAGQAAANAAETPVEEAPTGGQELSDILSDLGIS